MWQVPDLFLWFFCSERGWEVSRDCLSHWHRMPGGGQGARGEVTVWHSLVFVGKEAILWHTAVHLNENRNSNDVPKDCQTAIGDFIVCCTFVKVGDGDEIRLLSLKCCLLHETPPENWREHHRVHVTYWFGVYVPGEGMWFSGQVTMGSGGQGGDNNLTLSQVRYPWVSVVLHTSHAAVSVCIHTETKTRQLTQFQ